MPRPNSTRKLLRSRRREVKEKRRTKNLNLEAPLKQLAAMRETTIQVWLMTSSEVMRRAKPLEPPISREKRKLNTTSSERPRLLAK